MIFYVPSGRFAECFAERFNFHIPKPRVFRGNDAKEDAMYANLRLCNENQRRLSRPACRAVTDLERVPRLDLGTDA